MPIEVLAGKAIQFMARLADLIPTLRSEAVDPSFTISSVVLVRPLAGGEAAGLDLAVGIITRGDAGTAHSALTEACHRIRDRSIVHHQARMMRWIPQHDRPFLCYLLMHSCAGHRFRIVGRHGHGVGRHHCNCCKSDDRLHGASFDGTK